MEKRAHVPLQHRIAVTGGTGFLGRALIRALVSDGKTVVALARLPAKLRELQEEFGPETLLVVEGDLNDQRAIDDIVDGADAVVHCAALTHARTKGAFTEANVEGSANVGRAAFNSGALLVAISSIAARKPQLSDYAASKRAGELAIVAAADAHDGRVSSSTLKGSGPAQWTILRAPALYGPGDDASLSLFKAARLGLVPAPRVSPDPRASILYISDMVDAILETLRTGPRGTILDVNDETEAGRTWPEIAMELGKALDKRLLPLKLPKQVLLAHAAGVEALCRLQGKAAFVSRGKIREFFHEDWVAADPSLRSTTAWRPQTALAEGFAKTVAWHQKQGNL
ncbi:MAG: SDR family NAD(P)-dependent oxidoreductase [Pseudomonadota bacterium]